MRLYLKAAAFYVAFLVLWGWSERASGGAAWEVWFIVRCGLRGMFADDVRPLDGLVEERTRRLASRRGWTEAEQAWARQFYADLVARAEAAEAAAAEAATTRPSCPAVELAAPDAGAREREGVP